MSPATAAALGAAAEVPKNGLNRARDVVTPSAAANVGVSRTLGSSNGSPLTLNTIGTPPRLLNDSMVLPPTGAAPMENARRALWCPKTLGSLAMSVPRWTTGRFELLESPWYRNSRWPDGALPLRWRIETA